MSDEFSDASGRVEPTILDKSTASAAHLAVRAVLESDPVLRDWGIDSVLIGSYKRHVSIRRINDVDVFCKLPGVGTDVAPAELLSNFRRVLEAAFGAESVLTQARSLKVEISDWIGLHVDAVPARAAGQRWEIPDRSDPEGWQSTNPEVLTELTTAANEASDGLYVPTVKLLRQARRVLLDKRPGGLFVEAALYDAFSRGDLSFESQKHAFVTGLRSVASALANPSVIPDPTRPGEYCAFRATDAMWQAARVAFASAASDAEAALDAPRCAAEATYHRLLGTNSDGEIVYRLPDDCNGDGTSKSAFEPGDSRLTTGDQRFARDGV